MRIYDITDRPSKEGKDTAYICIGRITERKPTAFITGPKTVITVTHINVFQPRTRTRIPAKHWNVVIASTVHQRFITCCLTH